MVWGCASSITSSLLDVFVVIDAVVSGVLLLEHFESRGVALSIGFEEDGDHGSLHERERLDVLQLFSEELNETQSDLIVLESVNEVTVLFASLSEEPHDRIFILLNAVSQPAEELLRFSELFGEIINGVIDVRALLLLLIEIVANRNDRRLEDRLSHIPGISQVFLVLLGILE